MLEINSKAQLSAYVPGRCYVTKLKREKRYKTIYYKYYLQKDRKRYTKKRDKQRLKKVGDEMRSTGSVLFREYIR